MKVIIEFCFGFNKNRGEFGGPPKRIPDEISKELYQIRRDIKRYLTKECFIGSPLYRMDANDEMFKQVFDFAEENSKWVKLKIFYKETKYTKKEAREAVGFEPDFSRHYCEEYDDVDNHFEVLCKNCHTATEEPERVYAQPKGYIKKAKYGVMFLDHLLTEWIVTVELYEALLAEGISARYFRPVFNKKRKVLGYYLMSDNILPEDFYIDPVYDDGLICPVCGRKIFQYKKFPHWELPKKMMEDAVKMMKPVNLTSEIYNYQHKVIISPALHDLIKKYDKTAQFIPIFRE